MLAHERNEKIAMYSLSADPVTKGHLNIIERASTVFDRLIVAVGVNPDKRYLFPQGKRLELLRKTTACYKNVEVKAFNGLLVDFAYESGASVIVKGVRNQEDFEYESLLHHLGDEQGFNIDTHLLLAEKRYESVSSGAVKALQKEQGCVENYVPLCVKSALEVRISNQLIIGVTGPIASGKSTFCEGFQEYMKGKGIAVHNVDLDSLAHELFESDTSHLAVSLRDKVIGKFGAGVSKNGYVDRKHLGKIVFSSPANMIILNNIMRGPLQLKLKRSLYGKCGVILINAALLVEAGWLALCNNRVVCMSVDESIQVQRLLARGHEGQAAKLRLQSQFSAAHKIASIEKIINGDDFGSLWKISSNGAYDMSTIAEKITLDVGGFDEIRS